MALHKLNPLYGSLPAADFGPLKLITLRESMIAPCKAQERRKVTDATGKVDVQTVEVTRPGWCRLFANRQTKRVAQMFKWGASRELISATIHQQLATVAGLRKGKTAARESVPVRAVRENDVDRVLPLLPPPVRAMVEIEALTGMRPGEARIMRACDIDTTVQPWLYKPQWHKTEHHGEDHNREIFIGPKAQEIIKAHFKPSLNAYLFTPADAREWEREQRRIRAGKNSRATGVYPCELRRRQAEAEKARKNPRKTAELYDKDAFARCVKRACRRAGLSVGWTPNALRHSAATRVRRLYGLDGSQVILGHKHAKITEVYAEQSREHAREIMAKIG